MITEASGLGIGVGRFSRHLREVVVITMADAGLDTTRHFEVHPGAGVLRLHVSGVVVGGSIDCRCVVDGVEVTR
jgi:hypothetical protein